MTYPEYTIEQAYEQVERLASDLGMSPTALAMLRSNATAEDLKSFYFASEPYVFIGIAGLPWFTRRSLKKWWKRIDNHFSTGNFSAGCKELSSFRSEVWGSIAYDQLPAPIMIAIFAIEWTIKLPLVCLWAIGGVLSALFQVFVPRDGKPPRLGEMLIYLALPTRNRQQAVGDLEEEYTGFVIPRFGKRYAILWYWWQVGAAVVGSPLARLGNWIIEKAGDVLARVVGALLKP